MKKILLATAAFVVLGAASASAADLAARPYTKAPPMPVAVAYNWSGFYAGVMGGYGWSDRVRASVPGVGGVVVATDELNGGFGGGTIGYNWAIPGGNWLWGLEVDAAGANIGTSVGGVSDKINAFGSVTGRLGVTSGPALFYVKGGYAWANNKLSVAGVIDESKVHSGWTVGGGVEYMFAPSWSLKGEYMYADYSNANYLSSIAAPGVDLGVTTHTVKGGINYHFNWGGPVVARY